jgi:ribosomal protein S18 acetylase RimI-like enzyme
VNSPEIVVRTGRVADANTLREIRCESLLNSPAAYGARYADVVIQPLTYWKALLKRRHYFMAFSNDEVVGMLCVDAYVHEGNTFPGIFSMYVRPAQRGLGVASHLIDASKEYVRGNGQSSLFLDVVEGNERAISFYRREGFVPYGSLRVMESDAQRQMITMVCHL